jgi:hypothetical protein
MVLLAGLLVWCFVAGVADWKTRGFLALGIVLGIVYSLRGSIPDWMIRQSGLSLTADDDPANLSPRVYLVILFAAIAIAGTALAVGLAIL